MVSCIPTIATQVLLFRVSHKLGLTSYHEVFDVIDIVAVTDQQSQALMQSCLPIKRRATLVSSYSPAMNNIVKPARQQLGGESFFFGIIVHHRLLPDILGVPMHLTYQATVEEYISLFLNGLLRQ